MQLHTPLNGSINAVDHKELDMPSLFIWYQIFKIPYDISDFKKVVNDNVVNEMMIGT